MVLIQLRANVVSGAFLSTSYIGEEISRGDGCIKIKNACAVFEVLKQSPDGKSFQIAVNYYSHSMYTNGTLAIHASDVLLERMIDEGDEFLRGYYDAMESFRMAKLDIQKADSMPSIPNRRKN